MSNLFADSNFCDQFNALYSLFQTSPRYLPVLLSTSRQLVQMSNLPQVLHHLTTDFEDWTIKFYIWPWSLAMLQADCFLFALAVVLRGLQGSGLLCVMGGLLCPA